MEMFEEDESNAPTWSHGQYIKTLAKTDLYHRQRPIWFRHSFTGAARGIKVYKELLIKDVTIDSDDGEYVQI